MATCEDVAPDFTACGGMELDGWCLDGACVARGCGDGIRERGPMPAREGCDDGNLLEDDACTSSCLPRAFTIQEGNADLEITVEGGRRSAAVDGSGTLLFAWREQALDTGVTRLAARRYSTAGAVLGPVFPVHETFIDASIPEVSAASLASGAAGFALTWAEGGDIFVALVDPAGAVIGPVVANETTVFDQRSPSVAAVDGGFAVAWVEHESTLPSPRDTIRMRRFDPDGAPLGLSTSVPGPFVAGDERRNVDPFVVGNQSTAFVLWRRTDELESLIVGRRFGPLGALDASPLVLSDPMSLAGAPRGAVDSAGDWVVAYAADEDVYIRELAAAAPLPLAAAPDTAEVEPTLCAYGADLAAAHVTGRGGAGSMMLAGVGGALAPEEALLADELLFAEKLTLVPHPDGLVAVFTDLASWPRLRAFLLSENP